MNRDNYHIVYFIGIGGIGMSALARWFKREGKTVMGYDRTATSITDQLQQEGIDIHFDDEVANIPQQVIAHKETTLVVYTPAVPNDHKEFNYLKHEGYNIKKRSQVLGLLAEGRFTIAVAGTHGKTTTSSMIAHILHEANVNSVGFIGGVLQGYESNLIMYGAAGDDAKIVVEADEYDRSFLTLNPNVAVVTSADPDHLDIYGNADALKQSFNDFIQNIQEEGRLFINEKIAASFSLDKNIRSATYSLHNGQYRAENIRIEDGAFVFDFQSPVSTINNIALTVPGYHNVENATAAVAVATDLGIAEEAIRSAIASYKGVKRRFEYLVKNDDVVYIDDYAHHPKEIEALIKSVRALYPKRQITAIFQPHLFSRTRDFAGAFAERLSDVDELIMLNIYPARELPIEGVSANMILDKVQLERKKLVSDEHLLEEIEGRKIDVLLTIGAGNIDRFVKPLQRLLGERRYYA